jgi:hypothetical protein
MLPSSNRFANSSQCKLASIWTLHLFLDPIIQFTYHCSLYTYILLISRFGYEPEVSKPFSLPQAFFLRSNCTCIHTFRYRCLSSNGCPRDGLSCPSRLSENIMSTALNLSQNPPPTYLPIYLMITPHASHRTPHFQLILSLNLSCDPSDLIFDHSLSFRLFLPLIGPRVR